MSYKNVCSRFLLLVLFLTVPQRSIGQAPSSSPSSYPTSVPTCSPTSSPTASPTNPTAVPTMHPSKSKKKSSKDKKNPKGKKSTKALKNSHKCPKSSKKKSSDLNDLMENTISNSDTINIVQSIQSASMTGPSSSSRVTFHWNPIFICSTMTVIFAFIAV